MTQSGSRMAERRQLLKEQCLTKPPNPSFIEEADFTRFIVIEKLKFVFCFIPKVSCTTWKRVLYSVENQGEQLAFNPHRRSLFSWLKDYNVTKRKEILKKYYKAIVSGAWIYWRSTLASLRTDLSMRSRLRLHWSLWKSCRRSASAVKDHWCGWLCNFPRISPIKGEITCIRLLLPANKRRNISTWSSVWIGFPIIWIQLSRSFKRSLWEAISYNRACIVVQLPMGEHIYCFFESECESCVGTVLRDISHVCMYWFYTRWANSINIWVSSVGFLCVRILASIP